MSFDVRILTFEKEKIINDSKKELKNGKHKDINIFLKNADRERYFSSHYYDFFEFTNVETDENRFMLDSYEKIKLIRDNSQYAVQQCIVLFKTENEKTDLTKLFWGNAASHIFISMIKLSQFDESTFKFAKQKIVEILLTELDANSFIFYHSFDFSDLFLLAKNANPKIFQNLLWKINYSLLLDTEKKIIKDTITLFGIHQMCINDISNTDDVEQFETKNSRNVNLVNKSINAQISFGIQDIATLGGVVEYIKDKAYFPDLELSAIFGRRDLSIDLYNEEIYDVVKLYNKIKQVSKETENSAKMFISLKTVSSISIKDKFDNIVTQFGATNFSSIFSKSINNIIDLAIEYQELIQEKGFMDISEFLLSIKELNVNCFSEEFLISIYYSFFVFLKISINKMKTGKINAEKIGEFQRDFFSSINMMSHCTMHGEKCFIQAAPFNPLLFDVPPRLLAFYTAISYMVCKDLQSDSEQLFSFMFVPGFRDNINVRLISIGDDKDSRLLVVDIKEKMLYDPYKVISIIIHEIAHFVGNKTRCRKLRLHCILDAIAAAFFIYNYPKRGIYSYFEALIAEYEDEIIHSIYNDENDVSEEFYLSKLMDYLEEHYFLYNDFLAYGFCPKGFNATLPLEDYIDKTNIYYQYMLNMFGQYKNYDNLNNISISKMIQYVLFNNLDFHWIEQYILECYQIIGSFRESYADLILFQFIKFDLEQYIALINEELKISGTAVECEKLTYDYIYIMMQENKINLEMALRLSAICYVCYNRTGFSICTDIDNNLDRVVFDRVLNDLITYLNSCSDAIRKKPNFGIKVKEVVDKLSSLSDDTIYSVHKFIFEYKSLIDEEISKLK